MVIGYSDSRRGVAVRGICVSIASSKILHHHDALHRYEKARNGSGSMCDKQCHNLRILITPTVSKCLDVDLGDGSAGQETLCRSEGTPALNFLTSQ